MEARTQNDEQRNRAGKKAQAGSALPDLMVSPTPAGQRLVPGVTLTPTGWAFVAASSASSVTAVAAGVVLLRSLSTLGGGAPSAPPVEVAAMSRVVPVSGQHAPPVSPADPVAVATSSFVPIPAVGDLFSVPAAGPHVAIPALGGPFANATAAAEGIDGRTLLAGASAAGNAEAATNSGVALPAANSTSDVASTLALAAAAGAADGAAVADPMTAAPAHYEAPPVYAATVASDAGLPPLSARTEIAKRAESFRLLAASTAPTALPSKPLGVPAPRRVATAAAAVSAPAPFVAPAAVAPADLPDIAVTGLVLGDGDSAGVAVIQERGSARRRFVNVGDAIGEGDRFVVAAVDAHGVILRDKLARTKQNRTFRLGIQSATLRERLSALEAESAGPQSAAPTAVASTRSVKPAPRKPAPATPVLAAAPVQPAASFTSAPAPKPAASAPVEEAKPDAAPQEAKPAPAAAEAAPAPAAEKPAAEKAPKAEKAEEPHFLLTSGKSTAASESDVATIADGKPQLSWRLLAPASQVASDKTPWVIDYRVLLYELDEAEQKNGGEGRLVGASEPLSEAKWAAADKNGNALNPSHLYRWQVYARMSDGTLAVSPMAQFRVAP